MSEINVNVRTDSELEAKAQVIFDDLGLDMSTAFNIFLKQVVHEESISFEIDKLKIANKKRPRSELRGCMDVWMSDDFDAPLEEMQEYM
jgi:addiction module RelB/DinJ family antitoxin